MENKNDIGKILKQNLSQLDYSPNDLVWKNIEYSLKRKKKKKKIVFILFFTLLFTTGFSTIYFLNNNTYFFTPKEIDSKQTTITIQENNIPSNTKNNLKNNNSTVIKTNKIKIFSTSKANLTKSLKKSQATITLNKRNENEKTTSLEKDYNISEIKTETQNSLNTSLKPNEPDSINRLKQLEKEKKNTEKKLQAKNNNDSIPEHPFEGLKVFVFYGPSFSGSFSKQSLINKAFDDLPLKGEITSVYGLNIKTAKEKQNFGIGFYISNFQTTHSITTNTIPSYSNISLSSNIDSDEVENLLSNSNKKELKQKISFYNLSFNYYHSLFNTQKITIEGIGGVSFQYKRKNKLYLSTDDVNEREIGSITNVTKTNASLDISLGFDYKITKKVSFTVNPIFNLYLIPINPDRTTNSFNVYIQSGISYKF